MKLIGKSSLGVQVEREFSPESYPTWIEFANAIQDFINRWEKSGDPLVEYTMEESVSVLD